MALVVVTTAAASSSELDADALSGELERLYQTLETMASTDTLTRLGNRKRFHHDLATLVGERLRHSFSQAASFEDEGMANDFKPQLSYRFYSYPVDFKNAEDLIRLIEMKEEAAAAIDAEETQRLSLDPSRR